MPGPFSGEDLAKWEELAKAIPEGEPCNTEGASLAFLAHHFSAYGRSLPMYEFGMGKKALDAATLHLSGVECTLIGKLLEELIARRKPPQPESGDVPHVGY